MNSLRQVELLTPIGTVAVHIEGDEVVGRWKPNPEEFSGPKRGLLVEDFVNWGNTPTDIVRFTERYAPVSDADLGTESGEFHFGIRSWLGIQQTFQTMWELRTGRRPSNTFRGEDVTIMVADRRVSLRGSLRFFLLMELVLAPSERLRKCKRTDCRNPYFVATHLKQTYCSTECAKSAQAKWKTRWWKEKGTDWLKKRKTENKRLSGFRRKK